MSGKTKNFFLESKKYLSYAFFKSIIVNPDKLLFLAILVILIDTLLNIFIVERVPYTEIDWKAYMQECEGFLNGTFDYSQLRGDTGPLVYPAGFVYFYSMLYFFTNHGQNIKVAQYIFIVIYILQLVLMFRIYFKTKKVPPYVLAITILTSYRIHSIYVLRLFNDPIAVLLLYISLNFFLDSKWNLGSFFYSLGVSVKMNILLYAPALFFFYLINLGIVGTLKQIFLCAIVQLFLGLPFLLGNPVAYIKGSFDMGRVFNHTWTVNYRFLDTEVFESKCFHISLLVVHVVVFLMFLPMFVQYFRSYCRLKYVQNQVQPQIDAKNVSLKKNRGNKKKIPKVPEEEILSKDQEDFLNSFESMLQKSNNKSKKKPNVKIEDPKEISQYKINFDILSQLFILPMFVTNLIGVIFARSLHYQFYSWYFHSLPYLLWSTNYSTIMKFLILALIEMCWNTYPSTSVTSLLLHVCHLTLLFGVYRKISFELNYASKLK